MEIRHDGYVRYDYFGGRGRTLRVGDVQAAAVVLRRINLLILLLSGLFNSLTSGIDVAVTGSVEQPSIIGSVINLALGTLISMGATAFFLAAHDNPDTADLSLLWNPQPFWKYLGAPSCLVSPLPSACSC